MLNAIMGTTIFVLFFVWIIAEIMLVSRRVMRWFKRIEQANRPAAHVEQTINQMYGDVNVTSPTRQYAATRNAKQQIKTKGGRNA